ncbi:MAG: hypothetical protein U9R79_07505 [Armatimonadota bacterium]|nr:hypothetical protein [Armatimonadota bacterium]
MASEELTDCPICATFVVVWLALHIAFVVCWGTGPESLATNLLLALVVVVNVIAFVAVMPMLTDGDAQFSEDFFRAEGGEHQPPGAVSD